MPKCFKHIALIGLLAVVIVACTDVDLCEEGYHPHMATVTVRFHWPAEFESDKPDSMNIVASRLMNTWRTHGVADTETGFAWNGTLPEGFVIPEAEPEPEPEPEIPENPESPENPENPESPETPEGSENPEGSEGTENPEGTETPEDSNDNDNDVDVNIDVDNEDNIDTPQEDEEIVIDPRTPFRLKGGEYSMMTINAYENVEIVGIKRYLDDKTYHVDSLELTPMITPRNMLSDLQSVDLPDFNPKFKYVPNIGRVFFDVQHGINIKTGQDEVIDFYPEPISRPITVRFRIRLELGEEWERYDNLQIDSIVGEISGICGHMNLMNHNVSIDETYRIIYRPHRIDGPTGGNGTQTWESTFHTLGLIPSYDAEYTNGPGIIQLAVFASITMPSGKKKQRVYYAGGNPRQDFIDARVLEQRADGLFYLSSIEPLLIDLSHDLVIDGTDILNYEQGNIWFKAGETIDIDG